MIYSIFVLALLINPINAQVVRQAGSIANVSNPIGTLPIANGGTGATTAATARTSLSAAGSGANTDITSLNLGGTSIAFSSSPVMFMSGYSVVGTLASGATFYITPMILGAITLRAITTDIIVAGVVGGGDAVRCNDAAGNGLTATSGAGAVAGTITNVVGSIAIAYGSVISCHIDSTATTRPILGVSLEYVMQ